MYVRDDLSKALHACVLAAAVADGNLTLPCKAILSAFNSLKIIYDIPMLRIQKSMQLYTSAHSFKVQRD